MALRREQLVRRSESALVFWHLWVIVRHAIRVLGNMVLFPSSFVILAIWFVAVLRSSGGGYALTVAMLPFGMFAVIQLPSLGGLSITATTLFAALAAGGAGLGVLFRLGRGSLPGFSPAALVLGIFAVYAAFSAVVLARFFQGSFLVFPLARGASGVRIDPNFPSVMAPLWPSSANLSQSFYIIIAFVFFVAFCGWLRRAEPTAGERMLAFAAGLNVVLAFLHLAALDEILVWVQTATYSLHDQQTMGGLRRIIGGFPEPAPFGAASAAFFAYFASAWVYSHRMRDFWLAFFNGGFAILSYSSTGFAALAVVFAVFAIRFLAGIHRKTERRATTLAVAAIFTVAAVTVTIVVMTPLLATFIDLLDRLFLSKLDSLSGQERTAWAEAGFQAFLNTWGLGAGAGSLRSNGLIPVMLGSVGLPGTLAFFAFLWLTIGRSSRQISDPVCRRVYVSARVAAFAQLTALMLSATVPDPSLLLIICCALASVARESAVKNPISDDASLGPSAQPLRRGYA